MGCHSTLLGMLGCLSRLAKEMTGATPCESERVSMLPGMGMHGIPGYEVELVCSIESVSRKTLNRLRNIRILPSRLNTPKTPPGGP